MYLFENEEQQREETERFPNCWFTTQLIAMISSGSAGSQEQEFRRVSHREAGAMA